MSLASCSRPAAVAAVVFACSGCDIDTDAAVFVEPSIASPSATVGTTAFGTTLSGGFTLKLHLGPRATDPSTVSLGAFSLLGSDQKTQHVSPLEVASTTTFPVTVDIDGDASADFTFDTGNAPLPKEKAAELCGAGGLVVSGVIQDSLQSGGSTPVYSPVFDPAGCP